MRLRTGTRQLHDLKMQFFEEEKSLKRASIGIYHYRGKFLFSASTKRATSNDQKKAEQRKPS